MVTFGVNLNRRGRLIVRAFKRVHNVETSPYVFRAVLSGLMLEVWGSSEGFGLARATDS